MAKKPSDELRALSDALAEDVAAASSDEILEDMRADSQFDPEATRHLLLGAARATRKAALSVARAEFEKQTRLYSTDRAHTSLTPDEMRAKLRRALEHNRSLVDSGLTAAAREFEQLTDADVESFLQQLEALGMVEPE